MQQTCKKRKHMDETSSVFVRRAKFPRSTALIDSVRGGVQWASSWLEALQKVGGSGCEPMAIHITTEYAVRIASCGQVLAVSVPWEALVMPCFSTASGNNMKKLRTTCVQLPLRPSSLCNEQPGPTPMLAPAIRPSSVPPHGTPQTCEPAVWPVQHITWPVMAHRMHPSTLCQLQIDHLAQPPKASSQAEHKPSHCSASARDSPAGMDSLDLQPGSMAVCECWIQQLSPRSSQHCAGPADIPVRRRALPVGAMLRLERRSRSQRR